MAIHLKSDAEIAHMRRAGLMVKEAMKNIQSALAPGITTQDIEDMAQSTILSMGGSGSFNTVPGYRWFTCTPVNDQIVHTPPSSYVLKNGDVLTVDIGAQYEGMHVDHAQTWVVGTKHTPEVDRFLDVGKTALKKALTQVKLGNRIGHISRTMQEEVEGAGFYIVHSLVGHGVGHSVHEDPLVPNYLDKPLEKTMKLVEGLTIAVEIIYAMGTSNMRQERGSDWSIVTSDGSISGQFEHTIALTSKGAEILT
jgi:methionyl aminopeptidase